MRTDKILGFLEAKFEQAKDHLKRNSFSWVFGIIIPLYFFGTAENIKLLCWKITVVCAGCIVYHVVRKQMFPYLDPAYLVDKLREEGEHGDDQFLRAISLLAECLLLGLLALAIIPSVAGGL